MPRLQAENIASLHRHTENVLKVGVVGYCPPSKFDVEEARQMIVDAYNKLEQIYGDRSIAVISGLTNVGVLAIAYEEASKRNWVTIGVASEKALKYELYPVTAKVIIGKEWGDESRFFVEMLDVIIRIGGGTQSHREVEEVRKAKKPAFEYDLDKLD